MKVPISSVGTRRRCGRLRRLEETLGVVLLERTSRRVELTPAGRELRREAPELLDRLDGTARSVRAFAAGEAGTVDVGAQGAALITIVPRVVARLARERPALQVVMRRLTSEEQIRRLLVGALDLGLVREVHERLLRELDKLHPVSAGKGMFPRLEAVSYSALRRDGVVFRPLRGDPVDATIQLVRTRRRLSPAAAWVEEVIRRVAGSGVG